MTKTIKIDIKRVDGEYCVRWLEDGKRIESKCYYTDDLQDAKDTRELIIKHIHLSK